MNPHQETLHDHREASRPSAWISKKTRNVLALATLLPLLAGAVGCLPTHPVPVAGSRIAVATFPDQPSRNYVFFSSNDGANIMVPDAQSAGDPTMHGAAIDIYNPTTGQLDAYTLPAENWMALPAPEQGYGYLDVQHTSGPCEFVFVIAGKRLMASCRGEDVHFMLDESQQGTLNFGLTLGHVGGTRYCAAFGGHVMRDIPTSEAPVGSFLAVNAPAPPNCTGL